MDVGELVETYPTIFHMAESTAWDNIQRHGLLSTAALTELFELSDATRQQLVSERRPDITTLRHERHGTAVVRDNGPLNDKKLAASLTDLSPREYLRLVNGKVFFWPTERRLDTLYSARAYRDRPHLILEVDTASMLVAHADRVTLSAINSGATVHNPPARGSQTFRSIADYDFDYWRTKRTRSTAVAEICVEEGVPDVASHLVSAYVRHPDGSRETYL